MPLAIQRDYHCYVVFTTRENEFIHNKTAVSEGFLPNFEVELLHELKNNQSYELDFLEKERGKDFGVSVSLLPYPSLLFLCMFASNSARSFCDNRLFLTLNLFNSV